MNDDIDITEKVPCPFVYARGKCCAGHIVGIGAFKANLTWTRRDNGCWEFNFGEARSHYHLVCSEKGNHAGFDRPDAEALKFYFDKLPPSLQRVINKSPLKTLRRD